MDCRLYIRSGEKLLAPDVVEGIEWSTERKGVPGRLRFSLLGDEGLAIDEGSGVLLQDGDRPLFKGFVFRREWDRDAVIRCVAYDQLRYLKNKDTYTYENMTAAALLRKIATDYDLRLGEVQDTGHVIASRVEDNVTLFDMVQTALDITMTNTKNLYVLYDDAGKIALRGIDQMHVGLLVDAETAENYSFTTSIDEDTYNRVKLVYEDDKGKRSIYTAQSRKNIAKWGILQYHETISEKDNGQSRADALLALHNAPTKTLRLRGVLGDPRVRAGCMIATQLDIRDSRLNNFMVVETCTHNFGENEHRMDLTLRGGDINA